MKTVDEQIEDMKRNGYHVPIGKIINNTLSVYQENFLMIFGFLILFIIGGMVLSTLLGLIPYGIGNVIYQLLIIPMGVGIYYVIHRYKNNHPYEFSNFFDGYKEYVKILIYNLLTAVFILPFLTPVIIYIVMKIQDGTLNTSMFSDPVQMQSAMLDKSILTILAYVVVLSIGALYVSFTFRFALFLILFLHQDYLKAFKTSFILVNKKFFSIVLFSIVLFFLSISGFLLCIIGIVVTIPLSIIGNYCLFHEVFNLASIDHPMRDNINDYLENPSNDSEDKSNQINEMFR